MRQLLVAGNWKMHGSREMTAELIGGIVPEAAGLTCEVLVCPPFVYLADAARLLAVSNVQLGAQNVSAEPKGAFTGEISAQMLHDQGCGYVIIGHSERRALYGEDNALIARKFAAAQAAGMIPILCVGETLEERDRGVTSQVIGGQLEVVIEAVGVAAFENAVVAYEPVWAIGTGRTASPDQAQEVHADIRGRIAGRDAKIGAAIRLLYGGSVKGANAAELFKMPDVDGGLIGGASLDAEQFLQIARAAHQIT